MSIANRREQGDYVSNRLAGATAKNLISIAGVLELADKQASDTCVFNMRVQIPSPAPCEGTTTSCRGVFYIVKTKGFEVGAVVNDSLNGCQSRE